MIPDKYQDFRTKALNIKSGVIFLLKINNFAPLLNKLSFDGYNYFISELQKKIVGDIECYISQTSPDNFYVIAKFDIKIAIEEVVRSYIFRKKIYLSVNVNGIPFTQNNNIEQLKYQLLANLEVRYDTKKFEKTYDLYEIIHSEKLSIALQPVINKQHNVCGYECLLRAHDCLLSSTSEIVAMAEQMNLINTLDEHVLNLVIKAAQNNKSTTFNFNVSYNSISNILWSERFIQKIEKWQIAKNLIVEITETSVKHNYTRVIKFIDDMHKIGVRVALDDFGTGYTSFVQLKSFNVDFVKIDGLFIKNILYDQASSLFVKAAIDIAHSLNIEVVAECVENKDTVNMLEDLGADYLQGYYFGKPFDT